MAAMKQLWEDINYCLDNYKGPHNYKSCQQIADELSCPVEWVNEIVEQRWTQIVGESETA